MTIDCTVFTPWAALIGGLLIGAGAVFLMWFNGRIAGISGIVGGLFSRPLFQRSEIGWRLAFVAGLVVSPLIWVLFAPLPDVQIEAGTGSLIAAGLLVGLGTRYASGCTSGHGVCGLSRGSLRSLVATACFMGMGFVVVYLVRHALA